MSDHNEIPASSPLRILQLFVVSPITDCSLWMLLASSSENLLQIVFLTLSLVDHQMSICSLSGSRFHSQYVSLSPESSLVQFIVHHAKCPLPAGALHSH